MGKSAQIEAVERLVRESVATVDALAPEALRALLPALQQARNELRGELYSWLSRGQGQEDRFTAYERAKALRAIEGSLARVEELEPAMAQALGVGRHAVGPLAVANLNTEVQRLSAIFGGGVPTLPNINAAAIIAKGDRLLWRRHRASAARYAGGIGDDIRHQFAVALAKGETFGQMTKRLAGNAAFRSVVSASDPAAAAAMMSDGMFHKWRHWGDRLVRTENMHAYNTQHDLAIEHVNENRAEGEEEYLRRWDASADRVTCERCKELHETTTTIEGTFKYGIKSPPAHPYCRCVVLAWLERWGNLKGETKARHKYGGIMQPKPDAVDKPSQQGGKPKAPKVPKAAPITIPKIDESDNAYGRTFKIDHGTFDSRGRRMGGQVFMRRIDSADGYTGLPAGTTVGYRTNIRGARNGVGFGSGSSKTFATIEEATAHAHKALATQHRAIMRKLGDVPVDAKPAKAPIVPPKSHENAVRALAKGDISSARQHIDDTLRAHGFAPKATTNKNAETEIKTKLADNARGLHWWGSGKIEIKKEVADNAKEFAKEWEKDPKGARDAMAEYGKQREARIAGKSTILDEHSRGAKLHRLANDYRTLVHESLHGFGSLATDEYHGSGAKLEEVTTEVMARKVMRERFGVDLHAVMAKGKPYRGGSYEDEIQQAIRGIRSATGVNHKRALSLLEDASADFKSAVPDGKRFAHERIAESIARRTRPKDGHTGHEPSRYAHRRDGTIPTRHESKIADKLFEELTK